VRLAGFMVVLLLGAVLLVDEALVAEPPPKLLTAVFTLDVKQRILTEKPDDPLADQLARWASQCRIEPGPTEPGGAIAVLDCAPSPEAPESQPTADSTETIPATLALFRDLDETIYFAGCPLVEKAVAARGDAPIPKAKQEKVKPEDSRNCRDIATGQTFSAELEGDQLQIVVRGRQLAMQVFEVQEKPKTTSSPYIPTPSKPLPPTGPATTGERKGLESQNEPHWEPPQPAAASAGKPSEPRVSDVEPAHTSLQTGRVTIQCPSREFGVVIDGAYMGTCPITTTLIAGPHTITIQRPEQADEVQEIRVEAGKSLRVRMKQ
jgi:PEGA domain